MISFLETRRSTIPYRILSLFVCLTFSLTVLLPPRTASAQMVAPTAVNLPAPGTMLAPSVGFNPACVRGVTINPKDPLEFDFLVETGDDQIDGEALKTEANKLIKYFLASLTIPEKDMWVNLSPYEKNRIIPKSFGQTEMGRDLLAQDYLLKQLTASLMYPEDELGKKFWDRVYQKAFEKYGTTEIPMNTFNKVWIVPEDAVVYEHENSAYVINSHLKVMLEEDYEALMQNLGNKAHGLDQMNSNDASTVSGVSSDVVREVLIPEIEKEVNTGKNFATLRQIYNSMILATWYKKTLRESLLGQVYVDKAKTKGVDVLDKNVKNKIYNQYLEAFKKGVYNYIKEDYDPASQQMIPRKYFSGGAVGVKEQDIRIVRGKPSGQDNAMLTRAINRLKRFRRVRVEASEIGPGARANLAAGSTSYFATISKAKARERTAATSQEAFRPIQKRLPQGGIIGRISSFIARSPRSAGRAAVEAMHVVGNHIFMSVHAAMLFPYYIERFLHTIGIQNFFPLLPGNFFIEVAVGAAIAAFGGNFGLAWHERGHMQEAMRINAMNEKHDKMVEEMKEANWFRKTLWNLKLFTYTWIGKFPGIVKSGLTYSVDAPANLAVQAAGPRASKQLAKWSLPIALGATSLALITGFVPFLVIGRVALVTTVIGFFDYQFADPGKYWEYENREKLAAERAQKAAEAMKAQGTDRWIDRSNEVVRKLVADRIQKGKLPDGREVWAPWGFRNSGMGGRHTLKEYPKSNISMQETMFVPLSAENYEDAQEMTVRLQTRLMEIIEKAEGCNVMGIGLEGGIASYIEMEEGDIIPEQRLWRMAQQAILDNELQPGVDVALAIDPAMSELEIAYNEHKYGEGITQDDPRWEVGKYRFWRMDKAPVTMTNQEVMELYRKTIEDDNIRIVVIEDGFSEKDDEGWAMLMDAYGGELDEYGLPIIETAKLFIVGDDYVTTNDKTIEEKAEYVDKNKRKRSNTNATLIKANQIGSLSETILAMLTAMGKGNRLVVSHRSKSPNDDMEAQIAMAAFADGLKAGGGANTERLVKYQAVLKVLKRVAREQELAKGRNSIADSELEKKADELFNSLVITDITAYEEPTNAGIPTVGLELSIGIAGSKKYNRLFTSVGSTPLGTSAGTGEAIHLVDKIIERNPLTEKYKALFKEQADKTFVFQKDVTEDAIKETKDMLLFKLWQQTKRYGGKGVQNAVKNVQKLAKKHLLNQSMEKFMDTTQIDQMLLKAEIDEAVARGKISADATQEEKIAVMQRKGNLGMNAILSLSLALSRLRAKLEGEDLWELLRDKMEETMAKTILANGGVALLPEEARQRVGEIPDESAEDAWRQVAEVTTFHEMAEGLKNVNRDRPQGTHLYELLREQLPVYKVEEAPFADAAMLTEKPATTASAERATPVGGINLDAELLDLQIKRDGNGIPLPVFQQPIQNMSIEGFVPIIINVTPVDAPLLLSTITGGATDSGRDSNDLSYNSAEKWLEPKNRFHPESEQTVTF